MKVALATPCFLEGKDALGNDRLLRNQRYLEYYANIREELGFDEIFLFDNASSPERIQALGVAAVDAPVNLLRFEDRLVRGPGPHDYPYCWRALYALREIMEAGFTKIITIDSDGFVLTKRLANFIRESRSGWVSFWCENGSHAEASIHVLNQDAYPIFLNYTRPSWTDRVGTHMELDLPFTDIRREFVCSRFGERVPPPSQAHGMDYYGQTPLTVPLIFNRFERPDLH